ncbi:MAG: hypothetical protein U0359_22860 [Byssovorax sp.]
MGNLFDQLGKKIGLRALNASGRTAAQHEIPSNARQADILHEPDPARHAERARLGLLGRLAEALCLIELFSSAPGEEDVLDALGKLIALHQERRREAEKAKADANLAGAPAPAPSFIKPFLWIITAGRPTTALSLLGAIPATGWPDGVYFAPGGPPDKGPRRAAESGPGGLLRIGIIVATELPRERSTILVRIMAGGAALPNALADLGALPEDACEREIASMDVLELRELLGSKPNRTAEEEEIVIVTTLMNIVQQVREEGRALGRDEGRDEGRALGRDEGRAEEAARNVLTVLQARGLAVPEAVRTSILAEKSTERLERWLEKAVVASSIAEVLGDPS